MSTSREFHIRSFKSRIVPDLYFAIVLDEKKTRIAFATAMSPSRYIARRLARGWAENSRSKSARTLEPQGQN